MPIHAKNKYQYFVIAFLLLLFLGPIIGAWSLYSDRSFVPDTINYGQLITPPLVFQQLPLITASGESLSKQPLFGKWLLVYFNPTLCNNTCQNNLYNIRQVRMALGKNMDRVIRVLLMYPSDQTSAVLSLLSKQYLGTVYLATTKEDLASFLKSSKEKTQILNQGAFFLVDPLGNVMMHYPSSQSPKGIYNDLQRLLMTSQIG